MLDTLAQSHSLHACCFVSIKLPIFRERFVIEALPNFVHAQSKLLFTVALRCTRGARSPSGQAGAQTYTGVRSRLAGLHVGR